MADPMRVRGFAYQIDNFATRTRAGERKHVTCRLFLKMDVQKLTMADFRPVIPFPLKPVLLASATVLATACGGGGGSSSGDSFDDEDDFGLNAAQIEAECAAAAAGQETLLTPAEVALICPDADTDIPADDAGDPDDETDQLGASIMPSPVPVLNTAPPDVAGGQYYVAPNNSALLTGPVFGDGSMDNASLVKPLAFDIETTDTGLELLELRAVDSSTRPKMLGVIHNTGANDVCAVTLDGRRDYDATGALIDPDGNLEFALADGVMGEVSDAFVSGACIAAGDLAYVIANLSGSYSETGEIHYDVLRRSRSDIRILDAAVIPVSYSIGTDGVDITIVNQHSEDLDVFAVDVVAIDESGHAFDSDIELVRRVLSPGEEYVVEGAFSNFEGQASTLRAIVDFEFP